MNCCISDDELIASFENGTLSNVGFHHADHVHVAFLYLCRYPVLQAIERFSSALAKFAASNGKPQLYNQTVTWAFLLLIRERMAKADGEQSWDEFASQNPDLLTWKDNILTRYYRSETLSSELAKRVFLFPDKIAPAE
jgi:hypothetical protein